MKKEIYHLALVRKLREFAVYLIRIVPKVEAMNEGDAKDRYRSDIRQVLGSIHSLQLFAEGVIIPAEEVEKVKKNVKQIRKDVQESIAQYGAGDSCEFAFEKLLKSLEG